MSDALISEFAKKLDSEIFRSLIQGRAGFFAKKGIGTYESFLQEAGLTPPYLLPHPNAPAREAFRKACSTKARTIVRSIERSGGFEGELHATIITGPCVIHRAVNQSKEGDPKGQWGGWWFSDELLAEMSEKSRKHGSRILSDREFRGKLRENLRRALAIRIDWNAMVYLDSMKILRGSIPAITGLGSAQPEHTPGPLERNLPPKLRGGEEQIWLPWTPAVPLDQTLLT